MAATGVTPEEVWAGLRRDWWRLQLRSASWRDEEVEGVREASAALSHLAKEREVDWFEEVAARRRQLEAYAATDRGVQSRLELVVLVADAEPMDFLAGFWAGVLTGWTVALANPDWASPEWQSAYQLTNPQITWGTPPLSPSPLRLSPRRLSGVEALSSPYILIPTGGTSGQLKFTRHTWSTLTAAVVGFQHHFQHHFQNPFQTDETPINTCCVLPLYHVSGLLQALRTWLTDGQILITPFKTLLSPSPSVAERSRSPLPCPRRLSVVKATYLSLVPTQLSRLIAANKSSWLRQFHAVLLGGAPPWPDLLDQAAARKIPICLSYGMTETGAMVTAMRLPDFAQGNLSSGQPMPHAVIQIEDEGKPLPSGEVGQIVVTSDAIAHGYHNAPSPNFKGRTLYTDDLGYLDDRGQLHVTGRASSKIISGGENIFPNEVEAALRSTGQVLSVCVVGLPDTDWGEVVAAAYVSAHSEVSTDSLRAALDVSGQLSRYKYPKRWFALDSLPENAQGKVNRLVLQARLAQLASQSADY